jgi:hypothetical protein
MMPFNIKIALVLSLIGWALLGSLLTGCVSKNGYLQRADGTIANCHASGYGIIPAIMESNSYESCMQFYRSQGFVEGAVVSK